MIDWSYSDDPEVVCPYCEKEQSDSWELGDRDNIQGSGITECGYCGERFHWSRKTTVYYNSAPIEKTE